MQLFYSFLFTEPNGYLKQLSHPEFRANTRVVWTHYKPWEPLIVIELFNWIALFNQKKQIDVRIFDFLDMLKVDYDNLL